MMSKYLDMMQRCRSELMSQRNVINTLSPKADAYETIRKIVNIMAPQGGNCASEDLVYTLDRKIEAEQTAKADALTQKVETNG